jgi:GNAT superfamily N-acetyltransferase
VRESLERLLGEETGFTELHEVWLKEAYRRKGYGKKFFVFFEDLMRKRGRYSIIYFTGDPAAIAICRERGYQEALLPKNKWYVFYVLLKQVHKPKKQIIHCS